MALNLDEIKRELNPNPTNKDKFLNELKNYDIPADSIDDTKVFKENPYAFRAFMHAIGVGGINKRYWPLYQLYLKVYDEND